jgi:branched-chain amino acid aminotransferase
MLSPPAPPSSAANMSDRRSAHSHLDRGFTRSDATYDVTHVWKAGSSGSTITSIASNATWRRFGCGYLIRGRVAEHLIECVRLSGCATLCADDLHPRHSAAGSRDPRDCVNQLYAFAIPSSGSPGRAAAVGLNLHISSIRASLRVAGSPHKNFHWLDLTMGLLEAYDAGCDIDVLSDGQATSRKGWLQHLRLRKAGS